MTASAAPPDPAPPDPAPPAIIDPVVADVGGIPVRRVLPRAGRRTIGAWCFVDQAGPVDAEVMAMQVGPHPHIGLHTVSWLLAGELVHHDSLGNEQVLRPGEVNLMTAGHGIAHAELTARATRGPQQLVQLWIAQPEATRHGAPDFAHHDDLPRIDIDGATVTVLLGEFGGVTSPVRTDTALLGAEVRLAQPLRLEVENVGYEYGILPLEADIAVAGHRVAAGSLAYLPVGTPAIDIAPVAGATRVMVLGGEPMAEPVRMHWNFVARTADELARAVEEWNAGDERFGTADWAERTGVARIAVPPLRR